MADEFGLPEQNPEAVEVDPIEKFLDSEVAHFSVQASKPEVIWR